MTLSEIDNKILEVDKAICRHISNINRDSRAIVSQDILKFLRDFIEHIIVKIYGGKSDLEYNNIREAIKKFPNKAKGNYKFLKDFHDQLQIVVSHYTPPEDNSERLMLKYYEYLFKIRFLMKKDYDLNLLQNLDNFPIELDPRNREFYEKIAEKIDNNENVIPDGTDRFYIYKSTPFFHNGNIYYEVIFSHVNDFLNKTDRIVAFTRIPIMLNYASKMNFIYEKIKIMDVYIPICIIIGWSISIRECEFKNFFKLITDEKIEIKRSERDSLCSYMTEYNIDLLDIIESSQEEYDLVKEKAPCLFSKIDKFRYIINDRLPGKNILRYLLFTMNNYIIKKQISNCPNPKLSDLYLKYGAIPFDNIPFNFSLVKHNPPFYFLLKCFDINEYRTEIIARIVKSNIENYGELFTKLDDVFNSLNKTDEDIRNILDNYNSKLYYKHRPKHELRIFKKFLFIYSYVHDCKIIIDKLNKLSMEKSDKDIYTDIKNFLNLNKIDCEAKYDIINKIFANSKVAFLYGAAGTGKTTLINYISNVFCKSKKLLLAYTNTAVDNLRKKINLENSDFYTISKLLSLPNLVEIEYDLLIIDECSMVSNSDIKSILEKVNFNLVLFVGDTHQIESIKFGNWFNIARRYVNKNLVFNLDKAYRSQDKNLLSLWSRVRDCDKSILEYITKGNYSNRLDSSIFKSNSDDEVILCLQYDGLYGINNINRVLQENNNSPSVNLGIKRFKEGDPILFNNVNSSVIYKNMKGKILKINITDSGIVFDIGVTKNFTKDDLLPENFELVDEEYQNYSNSVIRYIAKKQENNNDDELSIEIPFQLSYAISIHKAQGLEYDSVKIVITDEIDEVITHNVFYTAITRTKKFLKIYWSPEVEKRILSKMKQRQHNKAISLLECIEL